MEVNKLLYILSVNKNIDVHGVLVGGIFRITISEGYTNKKLLETDLPLFGNIDIKPFEKWI